jgi:hypothetical protein
VSPEENTGAVGPCGACSEFVALNAELCPLCGGPTGFGAWTRLRATPQRMLGAAAILIVLVSGVSFTAGKLLGAREAAETKAFLDAHHEVDPATVELAREAELATQAELRAKIAAKKSALEELGPAAKELAELRAELEKFPEESQLREARKKREAEFKAAMKAPK